MTYWTFATSIAGEPSQVSAQRFNTIDDAANEAGAWLATCAENGLFGNKLTVELVTTEDNGS